MTSFISGLVPRTYACSPLMLTHPSLLNSMGKSVDVPVPSYAVKYNPFGEEKKREEEKKKNWWTGGKAAEGGGQRTGSQCGCEQKLVQR